jgi:hypothetical protein
LTTAKPRGRGENMDTQEIINGLLKLKKEYSGPQAACSRTMQKNVEVEE